MGRAGDGHSKAGSHRNARKPTFFSVKGDTLVPSIRGKCWSWLIITSRISKLSALPKALPVLKERKPWEEGQDYKE